MNIKQHIPNLLTLANLACGVLAIIYFMEEPSNKASFKGDCGVDYVNYIHVGAFFILIASVFDFLDGFAARLLKVQSEIGAQLDSLADLVTFGVAPGILFYVLIVTSFFEQSDNLIITGEYISTLDIKPPFTIIEYIPYLGIIIPLFSAYRLAKFNIDTEQTTYFKGLATPANAIFWVGVGITQSVVGIDLNPYLITGLVVFLSILMITNLKMFSLKIKNFKLEGDNIYRLIFLFGIIVMLISTYLLGNIFYSVSGIILLYILLSIPYHFSKNKTT